MLPSSLDAKFARRLTSRQINFTGWRASQTEGSKVQSAADSEKFDRVDREMWWGRRRRKKTTMGKIKKELSWVTVLALKMRLDKKQCNVLSRNRLIAISGSAAAIVD